MNKLAIIALEYLESDYVQTKKCLDKCPHVVIKADRKGYLGIAKAFNEAFKRVPPSIQYVWFVTNITFNRQDIDSLIAAMDLTGYAAITPCLDSDHPHIRPGGKGIQEAKFVEFTCPIVRADVFRQFQLDERMPYDIHDLDWSFRVKSNGHKLGVHYGVEVGHTYLRNSKSVEAITEKRKTLRRLALTRTHEYAAKKYGKDWRDKIWT
jgi:hypothetical protein